MADSRLPDEPACRLVGRLTGRVPSQPLPISPPGPPGPAALAARVLQLLRREDQFLELSAPAAAALLAIAETLCEAPEDPVDEQGLPTDVAAELELLSEELAGKGAGEAAAFGCRIGREYTPELQLAVLGLHVERLAEPVLDLGCGASAALVTVLRARGQAAYGVDREVAPAGHLVQDSWLTFPLAFGRWGTIISHMGFSLYFWHAHLRGDATAVAYARRWSELLGALRPGGCLAYAPALPFVERLLDPARWQLQTSELPPGVAEPPPGTPAVLAAALRRASRIVRAG